MACKNGNYGQIGQPRSLQAMRVPVYSERRANISWEAFVISLAQVMRDYPTGPLLTTGLPRHAVVEHVKPCRRRPDRNQTIVTFNVM